MVLRFIIFLSLCLAGKHLSNSIRNCFPKFVVIAEFHGGLYQIIFLFLVLVFLGRGLNSIVSVYPLLLSASWYISFDCSNDSRLEDIEDSLSCIMLGNFFVIDGGWLECLLIQGRVIWFPVWPERVIFHVKGNIQKIDIL